MATVIGSKRNKVIVLDTATIGTLNITGSIPGYASEAYVGTQISNLVDSSPAALNTLNELAAALGDDPNFATTVSTSIGTKWTQNNTQIANWNTAYNWGNHASAGYLTSIPYPVNGSWWNSGFVNVGADGVMEVGKYLDFHTSNTGGNVDYDLRVTASPGALSVGGTISATGGNSGNWNTAYGWGDHSTEGYLKSYTDTNTTYSAGTGITLTGTTFSLTDTNAKLSLAGGTMTGKISMFQNNEIFGLSGTIANYPRLSFNSSEGTHSAKTQTLAGDLIGQIDFNPYTGTSYTGGGKISFISTEIITSSKRGTEARIYSTKTGQSSLSYHQFKDDELYIKNVGGTTHKYWHAGNDGGESGLDADKLDGQQGSYYYPASNPNGYTSNIGDITGVTAGTGMTGGGTSGTPTLNVIGGSGITANANDIAVDSTVVRTTGNQSMSGTKTFTGALIGTTGTFFKDATAGTNALNVLGAGNGLGTGITFSDNGTPAASATGQNGYLTYYHGDSASYGSGNAFVLTSSESTTTILADGKLMFKEGIYSKPATGTGAGTRKDSNWDTAYGWGNHASAGYTSNVGDITGVTAGNGLTGGGSSGTPTLHVGAGSGISVAADTVAVDSTVVRTTGNQSMSGTKTFTGAVSIDNGGSSSVSLVMKGTSPTMSFLDDDTNADDFYIHINSNRFYVLANRTNDSNSVGTGWESPHPMYLDSSNNTGYLFEQRMFADNYHPNADKWTTLRTLFLTGDVTGSVNWDGSGNATMTTAVANNSHSHTNYLPLAGGRMTGVFDLDDQKIQFGSGSNSGSTFGNNHYSMGVDIANGGWSGSNYSDLIIGYHTGVRIGGGYSGVRFYNNSPTTDTNNTGNGNGGEALLMTIGGGGSTTSGANVTINNDLYMGDNIHINTGKGFDNSGSWTRNQTPYGYIEFGPANITWAHIYTDRPNFYFNKDLYVNNQRVFHVGYHPNADKWTTARTNTVTLTGDVTGSGNASVDGTGNWTVSIPAVVANNSHEHTNYAPVVRGTSAISNAGWTTVCTVDGNSLASTIRMTVSGTGPSTVIGSIIDIVCNHSNDILVTSQTSTYTTLYVKIISNNNEDFAIQLKTNSANNLPVNIEVFPLNNETVTFTSTNPHTGATLEHTCMSGGFASSSSGGAAHEFYSNGTKLIAANDNQALHDTDALSISGNVITLKKGDNTTETIAIPAQGDITGVTAGNGLTGGGSSGTPTLHVGAGSGISVAADTVGVDSSVIRTTGAQSMSGVKTHTSRLALSDGQMLSLGDTNHHLVKVTTGYSGVTIDGPRLQGHQGGELATNLGGNQYALRWDNGGNTHSRVSSRAPIFYDSDNTNYYIDPASTATSLRARGDIVADGDHGKGLVGLYSSTRLQNVFSMGTAFRLAANGTTSGNLYGMAWSHPNAGSIGGANNLNDHGLLIINNGVFKAAISSRAVFSADVRGTQFYDYNSTGYYVDPASTSVLNIVQSNEIVHYNSTSSNVENYLSGTGNSGTKLYWRTDSAIELMNVDMSGNFTAKGNVIAYSASDRQLKENIKPIKNALEKVLTIGGYEFDWNSKQTAWSEGTHDIGVIAQEIELVAPEATRKRADGYLGVDYEKLIPLLIESIKELNSKVETLELQLAQKEQ